jgi:hypothetical protein
VIRLANGGFGKLLINAPAYRDTPLPNSWSLAFRPGPQLRGTVGTVNLKNISHEIVATRRYGHRNGLEDRVVEHLFVFVAIFLEDAGTLLERFLGVLVDLFEFLRDI